MDKLKRALSGDEDEESGGIMADVNQATTFSWETRIKGFIACLAIGILLSVVGSVMVFLQSYKAFGILFSFGSIVSLASTCFLMGPINQIKRMFAQKRIFATIIVVVMIALTLMAGLWWKNGILCLLFVAFQYLALGWYSLSYIPYARDAVTKCFCACLD